MISMLEALKMQLRQAIIQLKQVEEIAHESIYMKNAKGILLKLGGKLR